MTTPYWYPLFNYLREEHGMTLTDSELQEVASKVDECRNADIKSNEQKFNRYYNEMVDKLRKECINRYERKIEVEKMNKKEIERFVKDREGRKE